MSDGIFFVLAGLLAAAMISLALVWPQGLGAPSPPPFGRAIAPEPASETPNAQLKGPL